MATFTVKFKNKILFTHALDSDQITNIGRLSDNDIVIDNVAVSGAHAQVISDQVGFYIKDLESKNGTFIDDKMVKTRRLNNGDVVQIGKHELQFNDQGMTAQVLMNATENYTTLTPDDPTAMLDTRNQQALLKAHRRFSKRVPLIVVKFKDKVIYKHLLKKERATIGRNPESSILIDNTAVSYDHAVILREKDEFFVQDLGSKNGTVVNNKTIEKHKLFNGDQVTIGRHELLFEEEGTYTMNETCPPSVEQAQAEQLNYSGTTLIKTAGLKAPSLTMLKGGKGKVSLGQKVTTIGKSPECDIVVKGLLVGDIAARICSEHDGFYLNYEKGFTKPTINGQTVKGNVKLKSSDLIELGSLKMRFHMIG